MEVVIPYAPRPHLIPYHERQERFACLVAHRRFGKTVGTINDLIKDCLTINRPNVRTAYIAPFYSQAKNIAWDYVKEFVAPIPGMKINESELRADFPNGARLKLYGADNYDAMRGLYFDAVALDEPADFPVSAWPTVIRPALADRKGRATFIGTPKGKNEFWEIYNAARSDPDWYCVMHKASETGVLDQDELDASLKVMGADRYEQEFECSFEAAIQGAYYAHEMKLAEKEGRICKVPHEPSIKVTTAWDLGIGDSTAIWFEQRVGMERRIIDYYENSGVGLDHYVKHLNNLPYNYGQHVLPHDVRVKELGSGKSRLETLHALGVQNVTIAPQLRVDDGIQSVRLSLANTWFDEDRCNRGIEALRQYRRDYDEKGKTWRGRPLHDWTSHGCLVAGSLVKTCRGEVPVEHVTPSDKVFTPHGWADVSWAGKVKDASELIRVTLSNGSTLTMTPEHKVFTTRGVVPADSLGYNDSIVISEVAQCLKLENASKIGYRAAFSESFGGTSFGSSRSGIFTSARKAASNAYCTVRRLAMGRQKLSLPIGIGTTSMWATGSSGPETQGAKPLAFIRGKSLTGKNTIESRTAVITLGNILKLNTCTGRSGRIITVPLNHITTFITSMATRAITGLRICRRFLLLNTLGIMQKQTRGLEATPTRSNCAPQAGRPQAGTLHRMAKSGTAKTVNALGVKESLSQKAAKCAAKCMRLITRADQSFAAGVVKLERFESGAPVYDLTVPHHHCYYANGMLVSNSDAFRYLTIGARGAGSSRGPLRRNLAGIA